MKLEEFLQHFQGDCCERRSSRVFFFQENVGFFFKADDRWLFMGQLGWCSFSSALQKVSPFHWGKADLVSYLAETTLISGMVMSIYLGMSFPLLDVNLECLLTYLHTLSSLPTSNMSANLSWLDTGLLLKQQFYHQVICTLPHWSSIPLQLVVSTHPKHISQIGSSIQVGLNIHNMLKSPQNGPLTSYKWTYEAPINGLKIHG